MTNENIDVIDVLKSHTEIPRWDTGECFLELICPLDRKISGEEKVRIVRGDTPSADRGVAAKIPEEFRSHLNPNLYHRSSLLRQKSNIKSISRSPRSRSVGIRSVSAMDFRILRQRVFGYPFL